MKDPSPSKLPLSRTRQARPLKSTPTSLQSRHFNIPKRPPLADKTNDSLELFGLTALRPSADRMETPLRQEQTALPARKIITGRERTTRVALKFGDGDETVCRSGRPSRTSRPVSKSRSTSRDGSTRGRSASLRDNRSRDARSRVAAPGATPSRVRSVEIPHTIARKRWDF
jgi:hypothetical protein